MKIFKEVTGQGEDVVILHGWGCDHRHMRPIAEQLADRYRVSNYDLPGRGQSDWVASNQNMHDIADQLLPHLPKQAIYVGWSYGGLVSISLAARYPERVKRFVGIGTTPKFIASDNWPGFPQPGFKAGFSELKHKGYKEFFKTYYDYEFASFTPKPAAYDQLIAMLNVKPDLDILAKGIDICDATDLRKEFKSLGLPMDFILGEKDESMPIALAPKMKELNSNIVIHKIPDANHLSFWTHPKEFNKILNAIL